MYATHCNTLQHTATHCTTLQHTATHCNMRYCVGGDLCNTLQHCAPHCNMLYCVKNMNVWVRARFNVCVCARASE